MKKILIYVEFVPRRRFLRQIQGDPYLTGTVMSALACVYENASLFGAMRAAIKLIGKGIMVAPIYDGCLCVVRADLPESGDKDSEIGKVSVKLRLT